VIELAMVRRMIRRGLLLAPLVVAALGLYGGAPAATSAAIGMGLAIANLWLAARVIGGVADNNPSLLVLAALFAMVAGLAALTGAAFVLQSMRIVSFPVAGFTLIGTHLVLVLWEAARAFPVAERRTQTGS
jgi:hypothetical protein